MAVPQGLENVFLASRQPALHHVAQSSSMVSKEESESASAPPPRLRVRKTSRANLLVENNLPVVKEGEKKAADPNQTEISSPNSYYSFEGSNCESFHSSNSEIDETRNSKSSTKCDSTTPSTIVVDPSTSDNGTSNSQFMNLENIDDESKLPIAASAESNEVPKLTQNDSLGSTGDLSAGDLVNDATKSSFSSTCDYAEKQHNLDTKDRKT